MKRPEKQHTVGAILLGTLVGSAIVLYKMPELIDEIVSRVYEPTKPEDWDTAECASCEAAQCEPAEAAAEEETEEDAVIPEEE